LWSLVLTSRKPAAMAFTRWVTTEVVPSIRKTGRYVMAEETLEARAQRAMRVLEATAHPPTPLRCST
jgi:anti-repressor protein